MFDEVFSASGSERGNVDGIATHMEDLDGVKGRESGEGEGGENEVSVDNDDIPMLDRNIVTDINKFGDIGNVNRKKNRRKEFKKKQGGRKGGRNVSVSPQGQERPRKRSRREEDPFDIDRFIGIVSYGIVMEGSNEAEVETQSNFCMPDLNTRLGSECGNQEHSENCEDNSASFDTRVENGRQQTNDEDIEKEAQLMVQLGEALGAANISKFGP
ncbi:hypothetical protein Hanom_Chr16g01444871 [Helianthus anomalus]